MELKTSAKEMLLSSGSPLLVHLPVEVKGRNSDVPLFPQRVLMRIRFANGEVREAESRDLRSANFEAGVQHLSFDFGIDAELYELRRLPATAEVSFYFLAFEPFHAHEFQKEDEALFIPGTGRCRTHRSNEAIIGQCLKIGDDFPVGFAPTPRDIKWYELSLSRLNPFFVRFRPTVFSWTVRLADKVKVEVDIDGKENHRTQFKPYEVPVRVNTSALQGVLVRKIQFQEVRFGGLPFRGAN